MNPDSKRRDKNKEEKFREREKREENIYERKRGIYPVHQVKLLKGIKRCISSIPLAKSFRRENGGWKEGKTGRSWSGVSRGVEASTRGNGKGSKKRDEKKLKETRSICIIMDFIRIDSVRPSLVRPSGYPRAGNVSIMISRELNSVAETRRGSRLLFGRGGWSKRKRGVL